MTPDPDDRQRLLISALHEQLVLETQRLADGCLRIRLTLALGLVKAQLQSEGLVPGWIHARTPTLRVVRTDGEPEVA